MRILKTKWDLTLFYKDDNDINIEKDIKELERLCSSFEKKYLKSDFEKNEKTLLKALNDYEEIYKIDSPKPIRYFRAIFDSGVENIKDAEARMIKLVEKSKKAKHKIIFFKLKLGKIQKAKQKKILKNKNFLKYKYFLDLLFKNADHELEEKQEKIISLLSSTSYTAWTNGQQKYLSSTTVEIEGKTISMGELANTISKELSKEKRSLLHKVYTDKLKEISHFAESEINAIYNFKKTIDELRGFKTPFESTLLENENSPKAIDNLVKTVTENFDISKEYYELATELHQLKKLGYEDRSAGIGEIKKSFTYEDSIEILKEAFTPLGSFYTETLDSYVKEGQIDVYPKKGKKSGAYMSGDFNSKSLVLLNHVDNFYSFQTFGHEMGHAFHTELSKLNQSPLTFGYSTSTAETASTFFEQIAFDHVLKDLNEEEKRIALFDRLQRDISTIFRQIACFNFELELHNQIRQKGFLDKKEIGEIHNKNMKAYLGPVFDMTENDGYMFVSWPHLRYYFYTYTYAYGLLVSKVLLKKYRENPKYLEKIEQFLKAGGSDSPENIFKKIGIDITKKEFLKEGLEEIRKDIRDLRKMVLNKNKV